MDDKLMQAILAMDSYNRGYNPGVAFGSNPNDSEAVDGVTQLGNVTVYASRNDQPAQNIGFYAIAYQDNTTGAITIAYRGTDETINPLAKDVFYGYLVGGGFPDTGQSDMAFAFYQSVAAQQAADTGNVISDDPYLAGIDVTGHSLGGGLAGLVGATYQQNGYLFDNMAFESAATGLEAYGQLYLDDPYGYQALYVSSPLILPSPEFLNGVYGSTVESPAAVFSGLHTVAVEGEPLSQWYVPGTHEYQSETDITYLDIGNVDTSDFYDTTANHWINTSLHDISTLVILQYAATPGADTAWRNVAQYFWSALYDGDFAGQTGFSDVPGRYSTSPQDGHHDYAKVMRTAIAYSALDEGERPFGDTGIRALYDDSNDLGKTIVLANASAVISDHAADITKTFVE